MGCPCCHAPSEPSATSCARCAAPLALADDPLPAPLDRALDLDRREVLEDSSCEVLGASELEPPARPAGNPATAPRWRRAAAWGFDVAVLGAASAPPLLLAWLALPAGADAVATLLRAAVALAALLGFAYAAVAHAVMGATFGKRLLGIQVVGPDGERPGLARSAARSSIAVLGAMALGLGVLAALFTRSRRGLHDLLADTVVIRTP